MNLFETLKNLKNIEPDPAFKEQSKRAVLAVMPAAPAWNARRVLFRIVETGAAVALTGFFVLLITGSLSSSRLAPVQYSAIDPASLHAEAQAIDMQIHLAQLDYTTSAAESTPVTASAVKPSTRKPVVAAGVAAASSTATSTATTTLSLDEALQALSN